MAPIPSFERRAWITLIGKAATGLFGLGTAMALSRLLPVEEYGNYIRLWLLYNLLVAVLASGFQGSIGKAVAANGGKAGGVLPTALLVLTAAGALVSALMFVAATSAVLGLDAIRHWLPYFYMLPPLLLAKEGLEAFLIATHANARATVLAFGFALVRFLALAGLVWWVADLARGLYWYGILAAVFLAAAFWRFELVRHVREGIPGVNGAALGAQMKIALPLGVSAAVGTLSAQLDKWMVGARLGVEELAWYANGAFEIPLVPIVIGTIGAVGLPEFARLYREGRRHEMGQLWRTITRAASLIMIPTSVFLFVQAEAVVTFLFSEKFLPSAPILRIYALLLLWKVANYGIVFTAVGRPRKVLVGALLLLSANFMLNLLLMPRFGAVGAAWATVMAGLILTIWYALDLRGELALSVAQLFPWSGVLQILALSLAAVIPAGWLISRGLVISGGLLYGLLLAAAFWVTGLGKNVLQLPTAVQGPLPSEAAK